jgi:hypothetical protein
MSQKRTRPRPSRRRKRSQHHAAHPVASAMRAKDAQRAFDGPATFAEILAPWEARIPRMPGVASNTVAEFLQRLRASETLRRLAGSAGGRTHWIIALCYCLFIDTTRGCLRAEAQRRTAGRLAVQRFRERTRRSAAGQNPGPPLPQWYRRRRGLDPGRPRSSRDPILRVRRVFEIIAAADLNKLLPRNEPRWPLVCRLSYEFSAIGQPPLSAESWKREEANTRRRVRAVRPQLGGLILATRDWAAELVRRVVGVIVGGPAARALRLP